ncbi:MFS transporter [Paenibacillus puldeungensis]|uniref:MFS transporter n=1 Tax=Paenibacillus puldeungensis TaxID=696536 RepID=A0ABW3RQT3_9BACL
MNKQPGRAIFSAFAAYLIAMGAISISSALSAISADFPQYSDLTIQMLSTLPPLFIMIGNLVAPAIANKLSKKRTILLGCLLFAVGMLPMWIQGFAFLMSTRVIIGFGIGIMMPLSTSLIFTHATSPEQAQKGVGLQQCGGGVGMLFMSLVGAALVTVSWHRIFLVHVIGLVAFLLVLIFCPQDHPETEAQEKSETGFSKGTVYVCVIMFIYLIFFNPHASILPFKLAQDGFGDKVAGVTGIALSLMVVGVTVGGLLMAAVVKVLKNYTLPVGLIMAVVGMLLCGLKNGGSGIIIAGSLIVGLGMGLAVGSLMGMAGATAKGPQYVAFATSMAGIAMTLGQFVCLYITVPITKAVFGSGWTYDNVYVVCGIALAILVVVTFINSLKEKHPEVELKQN